VITHDKLNTTEIKLENLKPNSDYLVQVVGFSMDSSTTSEPTLKHFRTLISDIESPQNLQVVRYEADKMSIKWDPVVMVDPESKTKPQQFSLIKGYRIYYKGKNLINITHFNINSCRQLRDKKNIYKNLYTMMEFFYVKFKKAVFWNFF
jgi:hypothetical protein